MEGNESNVAFVSLKLVQRPFFLTSPSVNGILRILSKHNSNITFALCQRYFILNLSDSVPENGNNYYDGMKLLFLQPLCRYREIIDHSKFCELF